MSGKKTYKEFKEAINPFTLRFRSEKLELLYFNKRICTNKYGWQIKLVIIVFLIVYACWRCHLLAEDILTEKSRGDTIFQIILACSFALGIALEIICSRVQWLNRVKGVFLLLHFSFAAAEMIYSPESSRDVETAA